MPNALQELMDKPLGPWQTEISNDDKMVFMLKQYSKQGRTLVYCSSEHILNKTISQLRAYCRKGRIVFPDYTPPNMRMCR